MSDLVKSLRRVANEQQGTNTMDFQTFPSGLLMSAADEIEHLHKSEELLRELSTIQPTRGRYKFTDNNGNEHYAADHYDFDAIGKLIDKAQSFFKDVKAKEPTTTGE